MNNRIAAGQEREADKKELRERFNKQRGHGIYVVVVVYNLPTSHFHSGKESDINGTRKRRGRKLPT